MKKSAITAAFALLSFHCFAANVPPELAAARSRYELAVAAATKPLRDRYVQELQQLKGRATLNKNMELAVAVDAELKAVADVGPSKAKLKALLPTLRLDGTWTYGEFPLVFSDTEATLMPNSKFTRTGSYEVIAARKVRVALHPAANQRNEPDLIVEIEFSKDMTQFTSDRPDLKGKVSTVVKQ